MSRALEAPGPRLLRLWARLAGVPAGPAVFSFLLGRMVPYSGTLRARIRDLAPGRVQAELRDRRRVRNHLGSIHAAALVNLGELVSGLAMLTALPPGVRGIVTALETTFHHKARGHVTATAHWTLPEGLSLPADVQVTAEIADAQARVVATVRASWRLGEAT